MNETKIKPKIKYSERETRLIVAWILLTGGIMMFVQWSISSMGIPRPVLIIDLLFPIALVIVGAYILKYKLPLQ